MNDNQTMSMQNKYTIYGFTQLSRYSLSKIVIRLYIRKKRPAGPRTGCIHNTPACLM
jgi:hypothetical protein